MSVHSVQAVVGDDPGKKLGIILYHITRQQDAEHRVIQLFVWDSHLGLTGTPPEAALL